MKINSEILEQYLDSGEITDITHRDFIRNLKKNILGLQELGEKEELNLDYTTENKDVMRSIAKDLREGIKTFSPNNLNLWENLFPNWKARIQDVTIYLLIGLPKAYDALALTDEKGNPILVYDLGNWIIYEALNIKEVIRNLLTHELSHICIHQEYPILADPSALNYKERLNAISFDEGFAHLLSFENKDISLVNWHDEKFKEIMKSSAKMMNLALSEKNKDKQEDYLRSSITGNYQEKFGAMLSMIYLGQQWMEKGNRGLNELFYAGYEGFIGKILMRK